MASKIDSKQIVSSEELLMSQVVSQEAVIRLLVEKGSIQQGGVFENGEEGRSGNQENGITS